MTVINMLEPVMELVVPVTRHNVYNITFGTYIMKKTWYAEIPQLKQNIEDMNDDE